MRSALIREGKSERRTDMEPVQVRERAYKYDTIRAILIFLVIVGHCLMLFPDAKLRSIHRLIYSFHIPAFVYITGRFARFDRVKTIKHLVLPYFVFQLLYCCFDRAVLESQDPIQFTTPYWIMWYLLAVSLFCLLIPMLPRKGARSFPFLILGSVAVALVVGFDESVGKYMSLSRFFVFLPFFLLGYDWEGVGERLERIQSKRWAGYALFLLALLLITLGELYLIKTKVNKKILYSALCYVEAKGSVTDRAVFLLTAFGWIFLLERIVPNKKLPVLSTLGQNTMPVYLLHGFAVRLAEKYEWFCFSQPVNFALACLGAVLLLALFGNKYVGRLFHRIF